MLQETVTFSFAVTQQKPTSRSAASEEQVSREEQEVIVGRGGAGKAAEGDDVQRGLARDSAHQERQALSGDGRQAG